MHRNNPVDNEIGSGINTCSYLQSEGVVFDPVSWSLQIVRLHSALLLG
jgi:hypothetical protein